jgi:DNA-binding transcriptional LysR family regulator
VDAAYQAESAVGRRKGKASGRLRLACASVFGRLHVIPRLPAFMERHPEVEVDLVMHDRFTDLIEEGIDLAIRVGRIADSGLVSRALGLSRRSVVAAPAYLERFGTPAHPDDLKAHRCILYSGLAAGQNWTFDTAEGALTVPVTGPFRVDNTEGVRAAVLQGMGIGYMPVWHFVKGEIESGKLAVLLRNFEPTPLPISAVFPSRRHLPPKVRAAIDFFSAEFHLDPKLSAAAV